MRHLPRRGAELRVTPYPSCIRRDLPPRGTATPVPQHPKSHGRIGLAQHRPRERLALANAECQDVEGGRGGGPGSTCSALTPGHKGSHCAGNATPPPAEPRPLRGFAQQKPPDPAKANTGCCRCGKRQSGVQSLRSGPSANHLLPVRMPWLWGFLLPPHHRLSQPFLQRTGSKKPPQAPPCEATEFPFGPTPGPHEDPNDPPRRICRPCPGDDQPRPPSRTGSPGRWRQRWRGWGAAGPQPAERLGKRGAVLTSAAARVLRIMAVREGRVRRALVFGCGAPLAVQCRAAGAGPALPGAGNRGTSCSRCSDPTLLPELHRRGDKWPHLCSRGIKPTAPHPGPPRTPPAGKPTASATWDAAAASRGTACPCAMPQCRRTRPWALHLATPAGTPAVAKLTGSQLYKP